MLPSPPRPDEERSGEGRGEGCEQEEEEGACAVSDMKGSNESSGAGRAWRFASRAPPASSSLRACLDDHGGTGARPRVRESGCTRVHQADIVRTSPGQVGLRNVLAFLGPIFSSI